MAEATLIPLFPDTLYMHNIDVGEYDLSSIEWVKNVGNDVSVDLNILDQEQFSKLKGTIERCLNDYFYNVLRANRQAEIYITESWLNKTYRGGYHHQHAHTNSVFSGVLYLEYDDPEKTGKIQFLANKFDQIDFEVYEQNVYNARGFAAVPKKGLILIFPSAVQHKVDEYKSDTPRISLSFNTFLNNVISKKRTTGLKLNKGE